MLIKLSDGEEIDLSSENLLIDESNLNAFLKKSAASYNYFTSRLAKAQMLHSIAEDKYDIAYSTEFQRIKESEGGNDKLVEAKSSIAAEVSEARSYLREAKYNLDLITKYVRSLDKVHDNALNLGYNIRKEMDKIFPQEVKGLDPNIDDQIANIFR